MSITHIYIYNAGHIFYKILSNYYRSIDPRIVLHNDMAQVHRQANYTTRYKQHRSLRACALTDRASQKVDR